MTAFREDMAVHGRFGLPCPDCGTAVQRIVYAENETNYCPRCQTKGKLLANGLETVAAVHSAIAKGAESAAAILRGGGAK